MRNLWQRLLCFLGLHSPLHVTRALKASRGEPTVDYSDIPKDAQVHARVSLAYITKVWETTTSCSFCNKKVKTLEECDYGHLEYNEMIYLQEGRVYCATPRMWQTVVKDVEVNK